MTPETVSVTDARGVYSLLAPSGDHIAAAISASGKPYEHRLLALTSALLRPGAGVVDIGANIGNHTVAWARTGARVTAIEPNPVAADLLRRNVATNGLAASVRVVQAAIGDTEGRGTARERHPDNLGSVTIDRDADGAGSVHITPLEALDLGRVRLVKIDVEGSEQAVVQGSLAVLEASSPLVVIELLDAESRKAVRATLRTLGYRMLPISLAGDPTFIFFKTRRDFVAMILQPVFWILTARRTARRLRHPRLEA
jgi:FkbM family methyltransferase